MEAVLHKPRLLRALTSLDTGEFTRLLAAFEEEVQARRGQVNRFSITVGDNACIRKTTRLDAKMCQNESLFCCV